MTLLSPAANWMVYLTLFIGLFTVVWMLVTADWSAWRRRAERQHLWYGCVLFLSGFWGLGVRVDETILFHPMLATALVCVFGLRLSSVLAFIATVINCLIYSVPLVNVGCNFLVSFVAPAVCARGVLYCIVRVNIKNLFVYLLGGGFLGSILSTLAMVLALLLVSLGLPETVQQAVWHHLEVPLLMLFPEGFANGVIVTTLTVLAPHLVKTYDDHFYLDDD